ncbi:MAG: hypothetical protein N3B13_04980, partial [Deltaproteobacteria bacterium]|nr:hypothetical protein [Deltaproteobacteria bacterium]
VILHLKRISGDGLFLLVLRDKERLFARQIIIEEKGRCPIRVSLPIEEFFEIPYKRGDFMEGIYNIELYMMNYNKMEWTIEGFEIK